MNRLFNLITLLFIVAMLVHPVFAQENTPEATPIEAPAVSESELPSWAVELSYGTLLVTALIGLGKYIPFLQNVPLERQKIVLVLLLLVLHLYVKENGDLSSFSAKITSLGELAARGVAFIGMFYGSSGIHEASGKLPMLGNSRPQA